MPPPESALVIVVPETEALVKPFRDRYDPSAAAGMPAHVTLLYPFRPPDQLDEAVIGNLRECLACFAPFRFSLSATRRFPDVLYLVPEPDEPFRQLTLAIWDRYPDMPPYGGKWPNIVPHLSVALCADARQLGAVADEFAQAAYGQWPIRANVKEVALMDNRSGRWMVREIFRLQD